MNQKSAKTDFVADALAAYIREGHFPSDENADYIDRMPLIDALRQRISQADLPNLIKIIEQEYGPSAGLAVSLLRQYSSDSTVKDSLAKRWETANPYLKNRIMWRMIDDPNLSQSWHRRFYEFILFEWESFKNCNQLFYGTGKEGICNLIARIGDIEFPDTKKWVYLCCVPTVINDSKAAKGLLTLGKTIEDPFAKEVANQLIQRFYSDK